MQLPACQLQGMPVPILFYPPFLHSFTCCLSPPMRSRYSFSVRSIEMDLVSLLRAALMFSSILLTLPGGKLTAFASTSSVGTPPRA